MSMMVSFVLSFFPRDVLDEILNLIESVSEDFPSYSFKNVAKKLQDLLINFVIVGVKEHVECDALKDWKLNIFKIIARRISFYSQNTNMLPRKPKISYRYLKSGIEEFYRKYVLVPADKAANNVVVV